MQVLVKMTHISLNTACHKSFRCFVCRFCNSLDSLVEMNENHNSKGQNLKKKRKRKGKIGGKDAESFKYFKLCNMNIQDVVSLF